MANPSPMSQAVPDPRPRIDWEAYQPHVPHGLLGLRAVLRLQPLLGERSFLRALAIQVHMAPALCPLDVSPYDFSVAPQLIERATQTTRHWIADGGLQRRAQAHELSAHHH